MNEMTCHPDVDALVVGAGPGGLQQLLRLREAGLSVQVLEAAADLGGTWFWNRYPGARFDSESYTYAFSYPENLAQEWAWSEHFAGQAESLDYLNFVADRLDLRKHIKFNARVTVARWDDRVAAWSVTTDDGETIVASFVVLAVGILSEPSYPRIEGLDRFQGELYHTARWPRAGAPLDGKRIGVIGTGASGVQVIQEAARLANEVTVFQRTPNWCVPLGNSAIDEETQRDLRSRAQELFDRCNSTFAGFLHDSDERKAVDVSPIEREEFYEQQYWKPGFALWMANFRDVLVDPVANRTLSDFVARKISSRVDDPAIAAKLIPQDHGFGTRRVPLETNYYEVYNQSSVGLVDLREEPIERMDESRLHTSARSFQLDMLILATGFNAVTGALDRIDIRGRDDYALRDAWAGGPRTFLGLQVPGFPNLFLLAGPHNAASLCNVPRCLEHNAAWIANLLGFLKTHGIARAEANVQAADRWTQEVQEGAERMLFSKVDSWFMARNSNEPRTYGRQFLLYAGGFPKYREECARVAAEGYAELLGGVSVPPADAPTAPPAGAPAVPPASAPA